MPYGSILLVPGVDVEQTPTLLKTGYSQTSLIRFRDSLAQKYGGWSRFYNVPVGGVPRELHAWEDLNSVSRLAVGTTTNLSVIQPGNPLQPITPQLFTSDVSPDFSTTSGSTTVSVVDSNLTATLTSFDAVFLNTPITVGGIILWGMYAIDEVTGTTSYNISASVPATSTVADGGAVPEFTTTSGSTIVEVTIDNHGLSVGTPIVFNVSTSSNGVTIFGGYKVTNVVDTNNFDIAANTQATGSGSFFMNSGNAEIIYYIGIGPQAVGSGYGLGGYGDGGFGSGNAGGSVQTGDPIQATDWTLDNWGQILLACPENGAVYQFDPTGGFSNAPVVPTAPTFNGGIFVSSAQETLVCWGSSSVDEAAIGLEQDPLLVSWSTIGDYTNFQVTPTTTAGTQRLPTGSRIIAGIAAPQQDLIWTDLDCWAMNFIGPPNYFGFVKIGAGAGAISSHSVQQLRGNVYWMGPQNFYQFNNGGVSVVRCPEWDFVFQNLDPNNAYKVRSMPNTPFNEVGWLFTSISSTNGENDCYVKFNITEPNEPWDFGPSNALPRSAWTDQSVLGPPIAAAPSGLVYNQESTYDADGQPLNWSFTTGYFFLADGEDFVFVDQILPDFIWGPYNQAQTAQVQMTFSALNFPGDTPQIFGPYTVTRQTQFISTRIRARQMQITVSGNDIGSFVRLGRVRYRYASSGRR